MADFISREAEIQFFNDWVDGLDKQINDSVNQPHLRSDYKVCKTQLLDCIHAIKEMPAADVRPVPPGGIGEMSDGYHTFNGLYYQRMVLFAALVKQNKDSAWKSHRHEDGDLCFGGGWFIVGLDTPKGSYTYHYEDKDWDLFDCEELPVGKHWDGHTEDDVTRLLSLPEMRPVVRGKWEIDNSYAGPGLMNLRCSVCGEFGGTWRDCTLPSMLYKFCPNCGAEMKPNLDTTKGDSHD